MPATFEERELSLVLLAMERAMATRDLDALSGGLEAVLDDGFEEFGVSGRRWSRSATLEALRDDAPQDVEIDAFEVELIAPDIALATYRLRLPAPDQPNVGSLRTSIWIRREGRWRIRFHQGTRTEL